MLEDEDALVQVLQGDFGANWRNMSAKIQNYGPHESNSSADEYGFSPRLLGMPGWYWSRSTRQVSIYEQRIPGSGECGEADPFATLAYVTACRGR